MIFSTTLRKDTSADRASSSFWHNIIVLYGVPHHPTGGIDPTPVDDRDAFVPVGRRSGIGPDASPRLYARESRSSQTQELFTPRVDLACLAGRYSCFPRPCIGCWPMNPQLMSNS